MQKAITVHEKEQRPQRTTSDQLITLTCHLYDVTSGARSLMRFGGIQELEAFERLFASLIMPLDPAIVSVECRYQNMHRVLTIVMVTQPNFLDADVSDAQVLVDRAMAVYNQSL